MEPRALDGGARSFLFLLCTYVFYYLPVSGIGKPKRTHEKGGKWPYEQAVSGLLWISGMTRPGIA